MLFSGLHHPCVACPQPATSSQNKHSKVSTRKTEHHLPPQLPHIALANQLHRTSSHLVLAYRSIACHFLHSHRTRPSHLRFKLVVDPTHKVILCPLPPSRPTMAAKNFLGLDVRVYTSNAVLDGRVADIDSVTQLLTLREGKHT